MGYLTPEIAPTDYVCRALFIPNSEAFLAIVRGAIQELTFSYNWTKFNALTPDECSQLFIPTFDKFCFNQGICRMIGEIIMFAGDTSPDERWLLCDGSQVEQSIYPDLYDVIGGAYGSADSGYFRLPDFKGRSPSGVGVGAGLSPVTIGEKYGEESHTLTEYEIPSHAHTVGGAFTALAVSPGELPVLTPDPLPGVSGYTGGGGAHNTIGPRLGVNFLIVAKD